MRSRTLIQLLSATSVLLAATVAGAAPPFFRARGVEATKLRSGLPLVFAPRPATDGSRRRISAAEVAPVLVRLLSPPTAADLSSLRRAGLVLEVRRDGSPRGRGDLVAARGAPAAVAKAAALPRVREIRLDAPAFGAPRPLAGTAAEIDAVDTWRTETAEGVSLTGHGMTVCDIDSGIDPLHPLFFRADGGYHAWSDLDGDGIFQPGLDGVDVDGDGQADTLRILEAPITSYFSAAPRFGSDSPDYAAGLDWLYADTNGNGVRDVGRAAGFDDASPGFGEPLFVIDDVNGDGSLDRDEKLVRLGTSKIKAYRVEGEVYRRGENLIDAPVDDDVAHGCGAAGVMVGGNRGLNREVGIAPDADLVMVNNRGETSDVAMADFCVEEGARVVLHEYAPWVGYHLDGSSALERFIDETSAEGIAHVNPAGNLSTSQKLYKRNHPAGVETSIEIEAPVDSPHGAFGVFAASVLWRDVSRDLGLVLEDPTGFSMPLPNDGTMLYEAWHDGLTVYAQRDDSGRGTARVDVYVYGQSDDPPPIPLGRWKIRLADPAPAGSADLEVIAYTLDERSGWGHGIHFPEHSSEDHLIGYPGTADQGIAVAAYTGHDWDGEVPGERAGYSGRGRRIDGEAILSISAPDNPITAGHREGSPAVYFVYGGTSGASPHVAGAAALLLQADPTRTGGDVRAAIRAGALADEVVGAVPNEDFGHGKLRVHRSLHGTDPVAGAAPTVSIAPLTLPAGALGNVEIVVADADEEASELTVDLDREYDGAYEERLASPSFSVSYSEPGTYQAKVRVRDTTGREAVGLARIDVEDVVLEEPPSSSSSASPELLVAGGGGCATTPGAPRITGLAALGLAALALRRRRGVSSATRPRR